MRRITILLLMLLLLLSACNTNTFMFSGESKNWSAELKVTQTSDDFEKQEFILKYKGQDIESVGEITYNVDTNAGGFGYSGKTLGENGTILDSDESNPTNAKISENSEVKVTVKWNGNTETLILTNN